MKWDKFTLTKTNYDILKALDLSEMNNGIVFLNKENSFKTNNVDLLLVIISENITMKGLTRDQEECNEYGRKLYSLYDEILYQNAEVESLDEELSPGEQELFEEKFCEGTLKFENVPAEEIEKLKKENKI